MSDDYKINKYFSAKDNYEKQYNKQRAKLKETLAPSDIRAALLDYKFSPTRKCSECSKPGGILFEETKDTLVAKCLAEKPCFSINIKRRRVSDLWESYRINKSNLEELDKSLIIMKYHSQYYFPTEQIIGKSTQGNSHKKTSNKGSKYNNNTGMDDIIRDFSDIEYNRNKEKKRERNIESAIDKLKNINAQEINDLELGISEIYNTLREFQTDDIDAIKKQITLNREQQKNYDSLRPLKYAYFAIEKDDETKEPPSEVSSTIRKYSQPEFSLITRKYSTQQCEYTI